MEHLLLKVKKIMNKIEQILCKYNGNTLRGAQTKLSKDLNVTRQTVFHWVAGDSLPSKDKVEQMAALFGISVAEVKEALNMPIAPSEMKRPSVEVIPLTPNNTINLPILADVPAGLPEWSDRDVEMFVDIPRFMFPGADFVVRCTGDSLEPDIRKGDYCVIKKMTEPLDSRPMLVKTDHGVCMKIIRKSKGKTWLCSLNPNYKPFVSEELNIIGLVMGRWNRTDKYTYHIEVPEE